MFQIGTQARLGGHAPFSNILIFRNNPESAAPLASGPAFADWPARGLARGDVLMLRIFRHYVSASALMLLGLESAILIGIIYSFQFVTAAAEGHNLLNAADQLGMASFFAVFAAAVMWAIGVYDKQHLADFRRIANRLLVSLLICAPIALVAIR